MSVLLKVLSRSPREIRFRIAQELTNLRLFALPPRLPASSPVPPSPLPVFPDPAAVAASLRDTPFAAECLRLADEILQHRFPLLGGVLETSADIRWRRDYSSQLETAPIYFRRIPYLDAARAGDHKNIWELNRHQHLVLLAQAYLFSGRQDYLDEILRQLESWLKENPFQRGINWSSALEVAFRALSWIWLYHLVGDRFPAPFRRRFLDSLYQHGLHLAPNLSYYFSPNTHLLGEAVALHAIGCLFPQFPGAGQWKQTGETVVRDQLDRQVLADGCHFELSLYYHVYALDMFLFHALLRGTDPVYRDKLTLMAGLLDHALGISGILPFIGDDDGGRFFHPYGERRQFGLATLATCGAFLNHPEWIRDPQYFAEQAAWWLPPEKLTPPAARSPAISVQFAASGLVVMAHDDIQLIADAGPFGPGNAGHTHADTLNVLLRCGAEQVLIDPGTYTYVGDPAWRNRFRGTAAHNTICIDDLDQASPGGPFQWQTRPDVQILRWETSPQQDLLVAACSYRGFRHQRTIVFNKADRQLQVIDDLAGAGEHRIEQFWHLGAEVRQCSPHSFQIGSKALLQFEETVQPRLSEAGEYGWISPALGAKSPSPLITVELRSTLPVRLTTRFTLASR